MYILCVQCVQKLLENIYYHYSAHGLDFHWVKIVEHRLVLTLFKAAPLNMFIIAMNQIIMCDVQGVAHSDKALKTQPASWQTWWSI